MSYILDALKKADQQRQHGKAPTLLSAQTSPNEAKPSRLAFNIGLGLALIGAGIFIGWLQPWQNPPPANPLPQLAEQAPVAAAKSPATLPETLAGLTEKPAAAPVSKIPVNQGATASTAEINSKHAANSPIYPETINDSARNDVTTKPVTPDSAQTVKENSALTLAELPASIRQQLPNISIAFHQYSPLPAERRVMINNLLLKQGDAIAPGLTLEKITPEGVVLSFMGYQFARGVR